MKCLTIFTNCDFQFTKQNCKRFILEKQKRRENKGRGGEKAEGEEKGKKRGRMKRRGGILPLLLIFFPIFEKDPMVQLQTFTTSDNVLNNNCFDYN